MRYIIIILIIFGIGYALGSRKGYYQAKSDMYDEMLEDDESKGEEE